MKPYLLRWFIFFDVVDEFGLISCCFWIYLRLQKILHKKGKVIPVEASLKIILTNAVSLPFEKYRHDL
jgi:hypothetical protein